MNASPPSTSLCSDATHQLRFRSLFQDGRALSFPCDAAGQVPLDALGERLRHNYLYARAVIGREFFLPEVIDAVLH
jgi:hypothetical protein